MRKGAKTIIVIALSSLLLWGCGTARYAGGVNESRDSTRVEYRTEYIERIDTAYIEIPKIIEKVITRDTSSLIENEYAISRALIVSDGHLYHTLETKPAKAPIPVKTVTMVRDSIVYRDRDVLVEKPVEVVKPLSNFVKFQILGFWTLLATAAVAVYLKIKKLL